MKRESDYEDAMLKALSGAVVAVLVQGSALAAQRNLPPPPKAQPQRHAKTKH
jgi:hypothetical protein